MISVTQVHDVIVRTISKETQTKGTADYVNLCPGILKRGASLYVYIEVQIVSDNAVRGKKNE